MFNMTQPMDRERRELEKLLCLDADDKRMLDRHL